MKSVFRPINVLLPKSEYDLAKWSVVACDQYTSQKSYWQEVENIVGNEPSTLRMIYPEVYLEKNERSIEDIEDTMRTYQKDVLEEVVSHGFVLTERKLAHGKRIGIVGAIDLEAYEFEPKKKALVKATEETVISRIPPHIKIRENAPLESSHIMVLLNDKKQELIEELYAKRNEFTKLYDFDLMMNGGHITGFAINENETNRILSYFVEKQQQTEEAFMLVGDGNHSLATAKKCWEECKKNLSLEEQQDHPARYAMVELVNIHSEALKFEPIHRVLFGITAKKLYEEFMDKMDEAHLERMEGNDIQFWDEQFTQSLSLKPSSGKLSLDILQIFLDEYMKDHHEVRIDYIHGEDNLKSIIEKNGGRGVILTSIDKDMLFPFIATGRVLPRKALSMGEAYEKRYYLECRSIKQ